MKLSNRLQKIANLVDIHDKIADVGCDHAYLSIYLAENKLCEGIIATEVVEGPYNIALNNIKKYHLENKKNLYLTNGLENVDDEINTIIIAGMGANTMIKILNNYKKINKIDKLIVQSNNDWELLRRYLNEIGYYIEKEVYVYENKKDYITIVAQRSNKKNTEIELVLGLYNDELKEFYNKQAKKLNTILNKISNTDDLNHIKIKEKINLLENYIKQRI